jgi:hypothetical protein
MARVIPIEDLAYYYLEQSRILPQGLRERPVKPDCSQNTQDEVRGVLGLLTGQSVPIFIQA